MINKIITYPIEQISVDDINLIFSIIQNIKNENDYKKILNNAFDYAYKFIINDISKGKNFINDFILIIVSLKNNVIHIFLVISKKLLMNFSRKRMEKKSNYFKTFYLILLCLFLQMQ